jgi:hypothetical protein
MKGTISRNLKRISRVFSTWARSARLYFPDRYTDSREGGVIVSLTSFPARISTTWYTVESLLRQEIRPEKIVLVLAKDEFADAKLPRSLSSRDVEILWVKRNTRSYKKLIPVLRAYPRHTIVTADDDIIYPKWWLALLLKESRQNPGSIIGLRGSAIKVDRGRIAPYIEWAGATSSTGSILTFLKGDGGILYPSSCLPLVAQDEDLAMTLCPTADDIWFKATALLAGTPVRRVLDSDFDLPTVTSTQKLSLRSLNVAQNANDTQFAAAIDHFNLRHIILKAGK